MCWRLLPAAGMRRREVAALRWRDVDLGTVHIEVRRSVGVVEDEGVAVRVVEGPTRTGQSRVVDLDAGTVAFLCEYRAAREQVSGDLVRGSALVLSEIHGAHGRPERFSHLFGAQVVQLRERLREELLPDPGGGTTSTARCRRFLA
jgi:integrase